MNAAPKQENDLTIDELARRSAMTVRNIRAHQSRGLLPPPEVRGRTGYYGPKHLERLEAIKELQADGFNLTAIQRLLQQADTSGQEWTDIKSVFLMPFDDEVPEVVDFIELANELGVPEVDESLVRKAEQMGFIAPIGDGKHEVISPTILRAGLETIRLGMEVDTAFEQLSNIRRHCRAIADSFARMVDEEVVRPFQDRGYQQDEWPQVQEAIERLRPFATEVVSAAFRVQMTEAAEEQFGKALARAAREPSSPKRARTAGRSAGKAASKTASKAARRATKAPARARAAVKTNPAAKRKKR